jgi:hypothetical protein
MPNYLDTYIPTPLGFQNLQYVKDGNFLLSPDPPYLSYDTVSFAGEVRTTKYYHLKLERELPPQVSCCEESYQGLPYTLELNLSEYQELFTTKQTFVRPQFSLGEKLWVPLGTELKIQTLFDVPPYWYAALLGAGCAGNEDPPLISFPSGEYRAVMERYNTESYYVGLQTNPDGTTPLISYKQFSGRSELWQDLANLEYVDTTWWNAFVPTVYKFGVTNDRLLFIQGLMDYKGWVDNGKAKIVVTSEVLMKDLHWLVRSLGGWTESKPVGCSKIGWVMTVYLPNYMHPFGVARDGYIPHLINTPPWVVKSVEQIEPGPYRQILTTYNKGYSMFGEVIVRHSV